MSEETVNAPVMDYAAVQHRPGRGRWIVITILTVLAACVELIGLAWWSAHDNDGYCNKPLLVMATVGPNGPLAQEILMYRHDVGRSPSTLADLMTQPLLVGSGSWKGPYLLDACGLIDPWGRPYQYCSPGVQNPGGFDVWSFGPDGLNGTADDIVGGR